MQATHISISLIGPRLIADAMSSSDAIKKNWARRSVRVCSFHIPHMEELSPNAATLYSLKLLSQLLISIPLFIFYTTRSRFSGAEETDDVPISFIFHV
jgi:hypothetical protein